MALEIGQVTADIKEAAAEFVGVEPDEIDVNKKLRLEYGISSIEASELIMVMEDNYELKIPIEEALKILTVQDAIDYVMTNVK